MLCTNTWRRWLSTSIDSIGLSKRPWSQKTKWITCCPHNSWCWRGWSQKHWAVGQETSKCIQLGQTNEWKGQKVGITIHSHLLWFEKMDTCQRDVSTILRQDGMPGHAQHPLSSCSGQWSLQRSNKTSHSTSSQRSKTAILQIHQLRGEEGQRLSCQRRQAECTGRWRNRLAQSSGRSQQLSCSGKYDYWWMSRGYRSINFSDESDILSSCRWRTKEKSRLWNIIWQQ